MTSTSCSNDRAASGHSASTTPRHRWKTRGGFETPPRGSRAPRRAGRWCSGLLVIVAAQLLVGGPSLSAASEPSNSQVPKADREQADTTIAGEPGAACFEEGTPTWYIEQIVRRTVAGSPFAPGSGSRARLGSRWSSTATDGSGLGQGDPTTLSWSYVPDGTIIPGASFVGDPTGPSELFAWLNGLYGDFATWHALFTQVFDRWGELTGIQYVYQPTDDGAAFPGSPGALGVRGDVRIGAHPIDGSFGIVAYNYFPNTGDMVLESFDGSFSNTSNNSRKLRNVVSHEHGHGLGLQHVCPLDQTKLMEPLSTTLFDGPQPDDVLGGQRLYGDPREHNESSGTATDLGAVDSAGSSLADLSIDDEGDVDVYRFSSSGGPLTLTVSPRGTSYLEGPQNSDGSCSAGALLDAASLSDLGVELLASDGFTVLASSDVNPAGSAEQIDITLSGAGSRFVRVSGATLNATQLYELELTAGSSQPEIFADGFETGDLNPWSSAVP